MIILSVMLAFASCKSDDMNFTDSQVSAVENLYDPVDNKTIYLENNPTVTLYFQWDAAKSEDGAAPAYEIVFDKANGDFSSPIYRIASTNNGSATYVTINHRVLNKIAYLAGYEVGEEGSVKWAVVSSRGINEVLSKQTKTLNLIRYDGFVDMPQSLFITGEGSEGGDDKSSAPKFTRTEDGVFEIYTKLEAGKEFSYIDAKSGNINTYYTDNTAGNDSIKVAHDEKTGTTVSEDGIYRISLNFNTASTKFEKITKVWMFYNIDNGNNYELAYEGNGVWKGSGAITIKGVSWASSGETRYKYKMNVDGAEESWGHLDENRDVAVDASTSSSYFNIYKQTSGDGWAYSFRYSRTLLGLPSNVGDGNSATSAVATFTLYFNTDSSDNYHQAWTY